MAGSLVGLLKRRGPRCLPSQATCFDTRQRATPRSGRAPPFGADRERVESRQEPRAGAVPKQSLGPMGKTPSAGQGQQWNKAESANTVATKADFIDGNRAAFASSIAECGTDSNAPWRVRWRVAQPTKHRQQHNRIAYISGSGGIAFAKEQIVQWHSGTRIRSTHFVTGVILNLVRRLF